MGNLISISYNARFPIFTNQLNITYLVIYLSAVIFVFIALYKELSSLSSKYVIIIVTFQLFLFLTFVYAPPRNADAMRVWLAKIYDILGNNELSQKLLDSNLRLKAANSLKDELSGIYRKNNPKK